MARVLRVLFVDPHPDAAESYAALARLWGHEACACAEAAQALDLAGEQPFDAAVIEPALPVAGGGELARRLRQLPGHSGALLVAVSGLTQPRHRASAEAAGFDLFLRKPCDPGELRELLDVLANKGPRPAPGTALALGTTTKEPLPA